MKKRRPTILTPDKITLLEKAWSYGCSDREACVMADIGKTALYDYCQDHKEFSERKELLKHSVNLQAKLNLVKQIQKGCIKTSMWWLERRNSAEFGRQHEHGPPQSDIKLSILYTN